MSDAMLKIHNRHFPSCGAPPTIDGAEGECYIGHFENRHGEQWIFVKDWTTGKTTLKGGDVGWDTTYEVVDGRIDGLILGKDEQLWFQACCLATKQSG